MGDGDRKRNCKKRKEKSSHSKAKATYKEPKISKLNPVTRNKDLAADDELYQELHEKVKLQYEKALEKLVALNYSKDVAARAILINGCVNGPCGNISDNIVGNCVSYIETGLLIDPRSISRGKPVLKDMEEVVTCSLNALIDVAIKRNCSPDDVIKTLLSEHKLFFQDQEFSLGEESSNCYETGNYAEQTNLSAMSDEVEKLTEQLNQTKMWAQAKVLQAAHRMNEDTIELHRLRHEKEQRERSKNIKEERSRSNETKLSELEHMLSKFNCDVSRITEFSKKIETDNLKMKADISASQLSASEYEMALRLGEKREKKYLKMLKDSENQVNELKRQIDEERQEIAKNEEKLHFDKDAQKAAKLRHIQEMEAKKQARLLFVEEEKLYKKTKEESRSRLVAARQELNAVIGQLMNNKTAGAGGVNSNKYSCLMCCEKMADVLFLPCRHQVICEDCSVISSEVLEDGCPCCQVEIANQIKVYGHPYY